MISNDNSPRKSSGCDNLSSKLLRDLAKRRSRALLRRWRFGFSGANCSPSWLMASDALEEALPFSFNFLHGAISPLPISILIILF